MVERLLQEDEGSSKEGSGREWRRRSPRASILAVKQPLKFSIPRKIRESVSFLDACSQAQEAIAIIQQEPKRGQESRPAQGPKSKSQQL